MNFGADDATLAYPLFQAEYGGSIPTSALQLRVSKCSVTTACRLNRIWHSKLPDIIPSNVYRNTHHCCFVAEFGNRYYATAIWTTPVANNVFKNDKVMLELRRFAIADNAPKNTASRMLRIMRILICKAFPEIEMFISYQDTSCHSGIIYKASGWNPAATCRGHSWTWGNESGRKRNKEQSIADKVRWEITV